MANPYDVRVVNPLEALMIGEQQYSSSRSDMARRDAQDALMAGDSRGALARLIGANDPRMVQALGAYETAANTVYGTPIYGTGPDGKTQIGTFDKGGRFRQIDTGGFTPTPGVKTIETPQGTYVIGSRDGQPISNQPAPAAPQASPQAAPGQPQAQRAPGFYPADNRGKARDNKLGAEEGEIASKLPSAVLQAKQTVDLIDELLGDKPTQDGKRPDINPVVGPIDQYRPSWTMGSSGRDALARFEQLQGKAFGAAFDMLRGGGQITEVEGVKATNAYARLQRYQDEASFRAALKDFRDAVSDGAKKLAERAGGAGAQPQAPGVAPVAPQAPQGQVKNRKSIGGRNYIQVGDQWFEE